MSCVTLVKAACARFLFGFHSLVTVWRVVTQEGDTYWKIAIGIIIQFLEGLHSLCYRKGEELKWFCPSVLIYLCTLIPAIWILELKTNRRETLCLYMELVQERMNSSLVEDQIRASMLMEIMQVKKRDLAEATVACRSILTDEARQLALSNEEGLKKILDINVNIALKPEQWTRILEQIALVVLILGRWLLPKGSLSRDQFSQLMLVYIGMAADIVEIFEAFRESKVILEPSLTYAILAVWTLSLFQFCLILSGGHRARKHRMSYNDENDGEDSIIVLRNNSKSTNGSRKGSSFSSLSESIETSDEDKRKRVKMDMIAIIASLALQDGPFICLRMTLIFRFGVISHMNIFFTCKNTLVILLQMYRLLILCLELRPQYRKSSRQFSIIPNFSDTNNQSINENESESGDSFDNIAHLNSTNISERKHKKRQRGGHGRNSEAKERQKQLKSSQRLLLKGINSTSEELALSSTSEKEEFIETQILRGKHKKKVEIDSEVEEYGVTSGFRRKATYI